MWESRELQSWSETKRAGTKSIVPAKGKAGNFYRQIALDSLSILFYSSKIQVEYPLLICYNKQWNEIPGFRSTSHTLK